MHSDVGSHHLLGIDNLIEFLLAHGVELERGLLEREVVIQGKVDGAISASERVELRKSAVVNGDVSTHRIAIEDGASFQGKIDIQREPGKAAAS